MRRVPWIIQVSPMRHHIRNRQGRFHRHRGEDDVTAEAELGVMQP